MLYGAVRSQSFLGSKIIFVDDRLPLNEQREEFAHELVYIWLHSGSQLVLPEPFIRAQESQADRTAMYLLIPTRFLERELDQVDFEKGLRRTGQSPAPPGPTAPSIRPLDHSRPLGTRREKAPVYVYTGRAGG
ncbi:MAG TPA: ImmA/IrrE family metallo-endopeptidase [Alicyclobacillus sp.]|nr:ImmA/IrrE family metallo-endopeptidase [Alicyclobacillus sp.]